MIITYLTFSVFLLNSPQPIRGGILTPGTYHTLRLYCNSIASSLASPAVYSQMKRRVRRVERGVERGNCLSWVTIMYLCSANTVSEMMD